jgi:hypothetical protein
MMIVCSYFSASDEERENISGVPVPGPTDPSLERRAEDAT